MNKKQITYKRDFLNREIPKRLNKKDTTAFCFNGYCGVPGTVFDHGSSFDAVFPMANPMNPFEGVILDDIKLIWICSKCTDKINRH